MDLRETEKETKNCVYCGRRAVFWTGHLIRDDETVIAGWCSEECRDVKGFTGHYKKFMGIRK